MSRTFKPQSFYLTDDDSFEHHGATVLLLVRNGQCKDWTDLCRAFRFDREIHQPHSGHFGLKGTIEKLLDAELLESAVRHLGPYKVTDKAVVTMAALGISLTQAANLLQYSGIAIRPFFGKPSRAARAAHVFVIMPFAVPLRVAYDQAIKAACRGLRLSVERADDIFSNRALVDDIWRGIVNSLVVIADCTGRNPNVFYELGIAHTLGKPVILITQDSADIPVDVQHIKYIRYRPTAAGLKKLESALKKTLEEIQASVWAP